METTLTVATRFRGPPASGNGGYTAGLLAQLVPGVDHCPMLSVMLRQPPPLDVAMELRQVPAEDPTNVSDTAVTVLLMGGAKIAEARVVERDLPPVDAVSKDQATEAMGRFPGLVSHPFPGCFSCGTNRVEGDGLRIFPGAVTRDRVASTWVPHESLAVAPDPLEGGLKRTGLGAAWAALDCVGGWAGDMSERTMVLGQMTAQVDALPTVGEPHVVMGARLGDQGRKTFTASTLYDSDGRIVGRASHIWIAIDPSTWDPR